MQQIMKIFLVQFSDRKLIFLSINFLLTNRIKNAKIIQSSCESVSPDIWAYAFFDVLAETEPPNLFIRRKL